MKLSEIHMLALRGLSCTETGYAVGPIERAVMRDLFQAGLVSGASVTGGIVSTHFGGPHAGVSAEVYQITDKGRSALEQSK